MSPFVILRGFPAVALVVPFDMLVENDGGGAVVVVIAGGAYN
jgi:uncharacterized protein (DUF302 family)